MATSFPTGLDALTNPTGSSSLTSPDHAGQHTDANDAIEALQAKVGVNSSAVTSSLDYKIANIPATSITTGTLDNARLPAAATNITSVGTLSALRVDGNFGIGLNGLTQTGLRLAKDIGGSAFSQGIYAHGTIQPSVTSRSDTVWSNPTVAASVTLPALNHFYASSPAIGAGSTITTVAGYSAESNLGDNYSGTVTNVYAFSGNIASGTGRWNFFANGNANNYMAGRLGVGQAVTSGAMAQVVNTTAADKAFIIRGAASQSGDFFDIQNSAGTSQFKVTSAGNTVVGATATSVTSSGLSPKFQIAGLNSDTAASIIYNYANDSTTTVSTWAKSRGGSFGTQGAVVNAETIGNLNFEASDGTQLRRAVSINALVDATPTAGVVQGRLQFQTANSSGTLVERMRIDSAGNVGIGGAPAAGRSFVLGKSMTGSIAPLGLFNAGQVQSDATNSANYFNTYANTAAAAFTCGSLIHYKTQQGTFGAGSTVSEQIGFFAESSLIGATNNYGFFGSIPSGTNRWNLYMAGTANNYMASNLGIGIASPSYPLHISGGTGSVEDIAMAVDVAGGNAGDSAGYVMRAANANELGAIRSYVESSYLSNMRFFTAGATNVLTERMRITSAGNIGIGNSGGGDTSVSIGSNITGATTAYGIRSLQTIQSGVTASAYIFSSQPSTAASAFTVADLVHFRANSTTIGSTSAVTNQYGFSASANLTGATGFNIGFHGNIASGTNRYNIYMDGTAQNYLAGRLGVGATLTSGAMTQVVNTTAADKVLVVKGAVSQSGSLLEAQNSSGTALVTIDSAGKVGIGNTAPENTLDITGSFGRGNPAVKTANFTLAGTENWIICNGAGTISITLPTPSTCDGREFGIKTVSPQLVQSASSNVIGISGGAAGTAILPATSGAWAILVSDGASWNIMCRGT